MNTNTAPGASTARTNAHKGLTALGSALRQGRFPRFS
jgi:hypothetical protein